MEAPDTRALIAAVGPERYRRAVASTQKIGRYFGIPGVGHLVEPSADQLSDNERLSQELEDLIMGSTLADVEKMARLLDVYRDLPTHGLLFGISLNWPDFREAAHALFWQTARDILDGENEAWARPLEYALDVDSFGRAPE